MSKIFTWSCPVCGEEFESKDEARKHIKQHDKAEIASQLTLGPNQWLVWYRTEWEEKLGLKKVVILFVLLLLIVAFYYVVALSLNL